MILKTSVSLKRRPSYGPLFFPAAVSALLALAPAAPSRDYAIRAVPLTAVTTGRSFMIRHYRLCS
jgi:hypothetical protein